MSLRIRQRKFRQQNSANRLPARLTERSVSFLEFLGDLPFIAISWNNQGEVVTCNQNALNFFHLTMNEVVGRSRCDLSPSPGELRTEVWLAKFLPEQRYFIHQQQTLTDDGRPYWLEWMDFGHFDSKGQFFGIHTFGREITEGKVSELALRESEAKYRSLFEMESDAILVIENVSGRILEVNNATAVLYGYSKSELVGMRNSDLSAEPEQTQSATQQLWERVPLRFHRKKDGSVFPVEIRARHFYFFGSLVHIAAIRDITETFNIQQALVESELRYRTLFEHMPVGLYRTQPDGRILEVNEAMVQMLGYPSRAALLNATAYDLYEDLSDRVDVSRELLKSSAPVLDVVRLRTYDGRLIWVRDICRSMREQGGAVKYFEGSMENITEQIESEEMIRNLLVSERRQREMADTLREVSSALTSNLDLDSILDSLLGLIERVVPYDAGGLFMVENRAARLVRQRGYEQFSDEVLIAVQSLRLDLDQTMNLRRMEINLQPAIVSDKHRDPEWNMIPGTEELHSWIGAPVYAQGILLGYISLEKREPGYYTAEHTHLLAAFARQAALPIQNARLYHEAMETLMREKRLNDLTRLISTEPDLGKLLPKLTHVVCELLGADCASLQLRDDRHPEVLKAHNWSANGAVQEKLCSEINYDLSKTILERCVPILWDSSQPNHPDEAAFKRQGFQSILGVPLQGDEYCLGCLTLARKQSGNPFNRRDLALLESVGRQTGIAIQKHRSIESARRRAQEAETLRQAAAAVTSALDLKQVLHQILVQLESVVPYTSSTVFLLQKDLLRITAARGFKHPEAILGLAFPADDELLHTVENNGRPLILSDASEDARYKGWGDAKHTRGWMGVSLVAHGKTIGFLTLDSIIVGEYDDIDAQLVQAFAHEAATAIENARLYREALEAAERRLVLHQAGQEINASLELEHICEAIHRAVSRLMAAEALSIAVMLPDSREIQSLYLVDRSGRQPNRRMPPGSGLTGFVVRENRSIRVGRVETLLTLAPVHYGDPEPIQSMIAVPLRRLGGEPFGLLSAQSYSVDAYDEDDQTQLEMLSVQAAIAIENARLFGEMQRLAITDPLTGLYNRRHFFDLASREFRRSKRYDKPLAIIMVDVDHFKQVNDKYGHATGDITLQAVANRCRETLRESDVVARYGGEEFILMLPESTLEQGLQVAERLRDLISASKIAAEEHQVEVTASFGVAALQPECPSLDALLQRADQALYIAKQGGKNRVAGSSEPCNQAGQDLFLLNRVQSSNQPDQGSEK